MPIVRDQYSIIVQHDPNNPAYKDGGDSARVTGLVAMVGIELDKRLCNQFVSNTGFGVRHPFQSENNNNNANNFTRDQLICLMAGLTGTDAAKRLFYSHMKRGFLCQNTHDQENNKKPWYKSRDILHLGNIGFMIQAAKIYWLYPLLPICWLFLILEILFGVYIKPDRESNQLIAMFIISGKPFIKLYTKLHPNWKKPIIEYWSGWRNQPEIAYLLINYILTKIQ